MQLESTKVIKESEGSKPAAGPFFSKKHHPPLLFCKNLMGNIWPFSTKSMRLYSTLEIY